MANISPAELDSAIKKLMALPEKEFMAFVKAHTCDPEPFSPLEKLDVASKIVQGAGHLLHNPQAVLHMEFAMSHLREAWIAESGQKTRSPEKLHQDVKQGLDLIFNLSQVSKPNG